MRNMRLRTGKLYKDPYDVRCVIRIVISAIKFNASPTEQSLSGEKPTIFVEFSGHIARLGMRVYNQGWSDNNYPDINRYCYVDAYNTTGSTPEDMYNKLVEIIQQWEANHE